ncbi:MAG: TRAP transporter TatT component family protein [Thermodesulfobacteriota bacterium]|nr:TRAP transporter TatT component family protein [Thermodesulfobacteriota bacterium]
MASLKRKTLYAIFIAVLFAMTSGCTSIHTSMIRAGITIAHPAVKNIEVGIFQQDNLELTRQGLPGTIMLLEGMLETSPHDMLLLTLGAKAYTGLGMMVEDDSPKQATALYTRGAECGMRALKQHRGFRKALEDGKSVAEATKTIESEKYLPALLWTAASTGLAILQNMGDPMIVVDLGKFQTMSKQINKIDSDYYYGFAHMFLGITNSILPATFGGDKKLAEKEFKTVFEMNDGKFLLPMVFYARFYVTDDALYNKTLRKVIEAPDDLMPEIALINQIAKAKARHYLKEKGEPVE